jgi:hypothetical protein
VSETESHSRCTETGRHVCQRPSGGVCVESACEEQAGTLWGPMWCPEHDKERLDRVSDSLDSMVRRFENEAK